MLDIRVELLPTMMGLPRQVKHFVLRRIAFLCLAIATIAVIITVALASFGVILPWPIWFDWFFGLIFFIAAVVLGLLSLRPELPK